MTNERLCRKCKQPGDFHPGRLVCKTCVYAQNVAWRKANPGKQAAINRKAYHRQPEALKRMNKLRMRARRVGLTAQELADIEARQGGKCAICGNVCDRMALDHCHQTGNVRALLCVLCNSVLGYARESTEILERAIAYLKEHR